MMMNPRQKMYGIRQMQGTAGMGILAALMVVAVITVIAVKQSWRSDLDLTRSGHRWLGMQGKAYSEGAEQLAVIALGKDAKDSTTDTLTEAWAAGFDFPTDHGSMQIRLVDAQSKLNLNALGAAYKTASSAPSGGSSPSSNRVINGPKRYSTAQAQFIRLLRIIPLGEDGDILPLNEAEGILEAVKDWVDADNTVSNVAFGGAEQDYYEQLDPPVTISNGPMISVSELLRVRGMTPELYKGVLPFVSALEVGSALNINTMGYFLARTMNNSDDLEPLDPQAAQSLYDEITSSEFEDMGEFQSNAAIGTSIGLDADGNLNIDMDGLDVKTDWFELYATVVVGDHVRRSRSLIARKNDKTRVVRRSDANF